MAIVTVAGEPGCRAEDAARLAAQRLRFEFVSELSLANFIEEEFGAAMPVADRAWRFLLTSVLARLAASHHMVICGSGAETVAARWPGVLRVHLAAPLSYRAGMLMLEHRLERPEALERLHRLEKEDRSLRKRRFGRAGLAPSAFDLVVNAETNDSEIAAALIETAALSRRLDEHGLLSAAAESRIQFEMRLELARHGIAPAGRVELKRPAFGHPSEEIFANLLDFYRIPWEYEPRSFPLQVNGEGGIAESFTPDFYLPEADLYVELTTMKQAHVTRKNRKVKRLRALYPNINIQVFYLKDFQNLVFKYGLAEKALLA